jgi:hypothetical protein
VRNKSLKLSALNIVLDPHTPEKYLELFDKSFSSNKSIKIWGQYYGFPSRIERVVDEDGDVILQGKFYRYTEIDTSKPWLDVSESRLLVDDHGNAIAQIDEYKKPNSVEIFFIFIAKHHRLVFDASKISHNSMKTFMENLFRQSVFDTIRPEDIAITIEQSDESIDEIINMYHISKLEININKPNPDDFGDVSLEQSVKSRLVNMNSDSLKEEYKSKNESITPDERTMQLMKVSQSNGHVYAKGKNINGKSIEESTREHPLIVTKTYNPNSSTYIDAMKSFAINLVDNIISKYK